MSVIHEEKTVNFREFRENLAGYLRKARQGTTIVVTSHGKPVARVSPPAPLPEQRIALVGFFKDQLRMAPDFDETPGELIDAMEGGA
jgi:prevent-host-death family protein